MQNDQFEQPVFSAPRADGPVNDDVERMRQQIVRVPTAAQKAKAVEDRRFFNSKANQPEIAAYRQRLAALENNNRLLTSVGESPVKFVAADDPRDVDCRALVAQVALLDRLINEQIETLNRCEAEAAEAERQRMIANETPTQRSIRILFELREVDAQRIADLEAAVHARDREIVRTAPARSKPLMSHTGAGMGDGLTPALSVPPVAALSGNSPRRISR
jgi:delta 1-pyrroline-5-carboxylate dehydrogenase